MRRSLHRAIGSVALSVFLGVGTAAHADLCDVLLMPPPLYDHPADGVDREYMAISDVNDYCVGMGSAAMLDSSIIGCTVCRFNDCTEYLPAAGEDGVTVNDVACVIRHEDGHVNYDRETGNPDSNHFGWL